MKKGLFIVIVIVLLLFTTVLSVSAEQLDVHVFDIEGILGSSDASSLENLAMQISKEYNCGVYIALFNDMGQYGYDDIRQFAEDVYSQLDLGYGSQDDGILLIMSMAERDYDLTAYGSFANYAFTDYGKEVLADEFLDDFRVNDWYSGFHDYITASGQLLEKARNGNPLDIYINYNDNQYSSSYANYDNNIPRNSSSEKIKNGISIGLLFGIIVAIIRCSGMKQKMKSAIIASEASEYVSEQGLSFTSREDRYSHSTVVVQHIQRDNNNRGGHMGGTSISSSGHSHSSGKF